MIPIVYADASILVCIKPAGLLAQVDSAGGISMVSCLEEQTGSRKGIFPVHRLDKGVGGLMVYALTKQAAADLSEQIRSGVFHKTYYAAVSGHPEPPAGEMTDLLYKDARTQKAFVVSRERRGVRRAALRYETVKTLEDTALVRVELLTGRFHQIRVQFASRKMPIVNDRRYGGRGTGEILLFSCGLSFAHPVTGESMRFTALPTEDGWAPYFA